jgi:hypothetical protein
MSFASDQKARLSLRARFRPEEIGKLPKPTRRENPKGKCNECGGWHGLPAIHVPFVGHAAVTDRLNKVFPDWTYDPLERFEAGGRCWIHGTITVGGITRHEYGDGTDPKEAIGNFIRRGAMRFGVALDLWTKEELEGDVVEASADAEPAPASASTGRPPEGRSDQGGGKADAEGSGTLAYGEGASDPDAGGVGRPDGQGNAESAESTPLAITNEQIEVLKTAAGGVQKARAASKAMFNKDWRELTADEALKLIQQLQKVTA